MVDIPSNTVTTADHVPSTAVVEKHGGRCLLRPLKTNQSEQTGFLLGMRLRSITFFKFKLEFIGLDDEVVQSKNISIFVAQ